MRAPIAMILLGAADIIIAFIPDSGSLSMQVLNALLLTVGITLIGAGLVIGVKS